MSVQINVTITRHNIAEIEELLDLALRQGADAFHVFMLVPVGCGAEIAEDLTITLSTARYHVSAILAKLGVSNRTEAAAIAIKKGVVKG